MHTQEAIALIRAALSEDPALEEAKEIATSAISTLSSAVVIIGAEEDGLRHVMVNPDIGTIIGDEDVSEDEDGQAHYAIHVLADALAHAASEQVEAGHDVDEVMALIMQTLAEELESLLDIKMDFGPLDDTGMPPEANMKEDNLILS